MLCDVIKISLVLTFSVDFLPLEDVEDQVCPVLLQLTAGESNDDFRSEAVAVSPKSYISSQSHKLIIAR